VHDTVELERCGIPTVLVTTTRFRPVVDALAAATGLPEIRALVVEHPIGGVDGPTLHDRAERSCDQLIVLFTTYGATGIAVPPPAASAARREGELAAELRSLVEPDGADFDLVAYDAGAGRLHLRLVIPDAQCAECVMPRAALESVAAARLANHGVRTVVIDDPREPVR
jgi:hypothetical protein